MGTNWAVPAQACGSWPIAAEWAFREGGLKETGTKTERCLYMGPLMDMGYMRSRILRPIYFTTFTCQNNICKWTHPKRERQTSEWCTPFTNVFGSMGHLNLCPVHSLMKGRFCFCRSTYMWNKEKTSVSWYAKHIYRFFWKKKHCYPVITRHKEVTAIAAGVYFTDRCAYCKSRPYYLVLMTKHKKKTLKLQTTSPLYLWSDRYLYQESHRVWRRVSIENGRF